MNKKITAFLTVIFASMFSFAAILERETMRSGGLNLNEIMSISKTSDAGFISKLTR